MTVVGVGGVTAVAAGGYHGLALDGSGAAWAWGLNYFGQLGDATTTDRRVAVRVPGIGGQSLVVAGLVHSQVL